MENGSRRHTGETSGYVACHAVRSCRYLGTASVDLAGGTDGSSSNDVKDSVLRSLFINY